MKPKYVVECRDPDGKLDFNGRQPHEVFGEYARDGINVDQMAKKIYAAFPNAVLRGETVTAWPSIFDSRWRARKK